MLMLENQTIGEEAAIPAVIRKLKTEAITDNHITGITLVPFDGSEAGSYEKWLSDPDVIKYLYPNIPFTTDPERKVSPQEFVRYMRDNPRFAFFRIQHPQYGFIGHASLNGIDTND